jgi:nucleoside-diphosphate-sugar epimerase
MRDFTAKPVIFITGGTGYIAGTFLHLMISRDYSSQFEISALVRRSDDARRMTELGVTPILGTLEDGDLLRRASRRASIVFNTANCDHQDSAKAIIQGLMERAQESGDRPILIHTSGAGVLSASSRSAGVPPTEDPMARPWIDTDVAAHAAIPAHAPHRFVDLEVFAAAKTGKIKTYLVVPPTVFGRGLGPFAASRMSIQIPRLVYYSLMRRRAQYVGTGANRWPNVHVADLAELYLIIMNAALNNSAPEGLEGLYYPATEHFTWSTVADRIGQVLHRRGLLDYPTAIPGLPGGWFWGSNVWMKCENGETLGWGPRHGGTKEMLDCVDWDVSLVTQTGVSG